MIPSIARGPSVCPSVTLMYPAKAVGWMHNVGNCNMESVLLSPGDIGISQCLDSDHAA